MEDASALGAKYLLAAGDITAEAVPVDLSKAGQLLGGSAATPRLLRHPRQPRPGAHRRPVRGCRAGQWQGNDCFHDQFFPGDEPTYFRRDLQGLRVIGIDTYDKPGNGGDAGALSPEQLAWFRAELAKDRDQPTMVFGHHPLVVQESPFPISASNTLDATQAATILEDYSRMPGLFLHHAGHTHRNKRTISPVAPG